MKCMLFILCLSRMFWYDFKSLLMNHRYILVVKTMVFNIVFFCLRW